MCRGGCCCHFSLKCRTDSLRHSAVNMIVFGSLMAALGVVLRVFLEEWIFNFGFALIWAGVAALVTGIGSLSVARTMRYNDEDCGIRGLVLLCLVCIVCVGAAVGLITWQMWEADYFGPFEEGKVYKSENETLVFLEWFAAIFIYGLMDLAALLIVSSAVLNLLIGCFCPEGSEVVKIV